MKSIVITGSTKGIGLAMAKEFLRKGCQVTLSGRGTFPDESLRAELNALPGAWIYVPCNVQSTVGLKHLWNESIRQWKGVDIWINNAGRSTPHLKVWETGEDHTEQLVKTNLLGMIYGAQVASMGMLKQGHGAIYAMEGLGSNNMIQSGTILYGTTKHALTYFMKGLAKELDGTGVIAGRLSPGMMLTDFITSPPDGRPAEVFTNPRFRRLFNILADRPETVAGFFIPRMLNNTKNDRRIAWLTNRKVAWRFATASLRKETLV